MEADNFVFTGGIYAHMLELYAHHDKLEEVESILKKLQEKEPDFAMDSSKIIKIVTLLIKCDKVPGKKICSVVFLLLSFVRLLYILTIGSLGFLHS